MLRVSPSLHENITELVVKDLERINRPVDAKDTDVEILIGLACENDAEVRMLRSSSDWPTRWWIKRAFINQ